MICYLYPEPSFFFFSSDVPALLYYAQIPATLVALFLSSFALWNGRKLLLNRLLFAISILFSLWTIINLITWTNIHSDILLFAWSFFGLIFGLISIFCINFIYVFLDKKDVSNKIKFIFLVLLAPVIFLTPTYLNLSGFNITDCDAFEFERLSYQVYYTLLGVLAMVWIFVLLVNRYFKAPSDMKKQIVLMGIGIESFLFLFFVMVFLASYLTGKGILPDSGLELYGLFGMVIFMIYISVLIVRFHAFNVKLLATQALVFGLGVLVFAMLFIQHIEYIRVITSITLILILVVGIALIRSVKREITQRELIEIQAIDLEQANERQESLIHFISHEVKGYLTKDQAIFAGIQEGDYGQSNPQLSDIVALGFKETQKGVDTVIDILSASNLKKGTVIYDMKPFDLKAAVAEATDDIRPTAIEKGLQIENDLPREDFTIKGDREQIVKHVIRNIIDNSIKYTLKGGLIVGLKKQNGKILFYVKDTGIGITSEDKKRLFTEGGRGRDSVKVNVDSTGYGLFIAKQIVEAHKGKIWVESEGKGKGSTFYVEF